MLEKIFSKASYRFIVLLLSITFLNTTTIYAKGSRFIKSVSVESEVIDVSKQETTNIFFELKEIGHVDLFICTLTGDVVRKLLNRSELAAGSHQINWDGKTDGGHTCIDDAYIPVIKLRTMYKGNDLFNPTTEHWGQWIELTNVKFNSQKGIVSYKVGQSAICTIRAGETEGGPLHKMILDWKPLKKGYYETPWNGRDAQNIADVTSRPNFAIVAEGFTVPKTCIILTGSKTQRFDTETFDSFPMSPPPDSKMAPHAMHKRQNCQPYHIKAHIKKKNKSKNEDDIDVVKGIVEFEIYNTNIKDEQRLKRETFELCLFVDGIYISETPQANLPSTVKLDTSKQKNGEHIITIVLLTTGDHWGTYASRIRIDN